MKKLSTGLLLLVTLAVPVVTAQPLAGDPIVACLPPGNGLYRVARTGAVETILGKSFLFPNAVTMWSDNTDLAVALAEPSASYVSNRFLRVGPDGTTSTVALIRPGPPNAVDLAEDGQWLVFAASQNAVLKVAPTGGSLTSVQTLPAGALNAGAVDLADGGLFMGAYWQWPQGGLCKAMPSGQVVTLAWGLGRVSGVAPDPLRGDVVVTRFDSPEVLRIDSTGRVTSLAVFQGANAAAVDPDGSLWLAGGTVLLQATATGVPVRTYALPGSATGVEIYGRRVLTGTGRTTPGSTYTLRIHSHRSGDGGRPYQLVASTVLGPALPFGDGRSVVIGMSPLLLMSFFDRVPFFHDFKGTLDPFGRARAAIRVPAGLSGLSGLRLFVTGVVYDLRLHRVSTVMNTVGLTLQ